MKRIYCYSKEGAGYDAPLAEVLGLFAKCGHPRAAELLDSVNAIEARISVGETVTQEELDALSGQSVWRIEG